MKKILVVEDDAFLIKAYQVKLAKSNFKVEIAKDGEEAMEKLKEFSPDLILLDLVMPKMDGFAVLEALRADEKLSQIPVMVASNLGQKEDIEKAKRLGAKGFVIKSDMSLDEILKKVSALVGSE